jgi:hypothetical protein
MTNAIAAKAAVRIINPSNWVLTEEVENKWMCGNRNLRTEPHSLGPRKTNAGPNLRLCAKFWSLRSAVIVEIKTGPRRASISLLVTLALIWRQFVLSRFASSLRLDAEIPLRAAACHRLTFLA